jgi:cytidine deaminase
MKINGELIRTIRLQRNFSQEFVADSLGMSQSAYSRLENGKTRIPVRRFKKLMYLFDFNLAQFRQLIIEGEEKLSAEMPRKTYNNLFNSVLLPPEKLDNSTISRSHSTMKQQFTIAYEHYSSTRDLSLPRFNLIQEAQQAIQGAYAPYSKFKVGCALELEDETIIHGSNQENVAYPSGLCAERTALFHYGANHADQKIKRLAIAAEGSFLPKGNVLSPCGSCRQVMSEYTQKQQSSFEILLFNNDGSVLIFDSIKDLLPFSFATE